MADPILEIDAAASGIGGTNPGSALTITTGNYGLTSLVSPAPPEKIQWASSVDTEGSLAASVGHENRTIAVTLDVSGATALNNLTGKIAKLGREGGTLKHTGKNGTVVIADVLATGGYEPAYDLTRLLGDLTTVQFTLPAKPYLRGTEQDLGDNVETTAPWLIFTEASIPGEVPALGRLLIDEDEGQDQQFAIWGIQSRYYDSAATAALFYEAESCALLGGGSLAVGAAGASGAGSNVVTNTSLTTGLTGLMYVGTSSTAQTHLGGFRVLVRVYAPNTNTGTVSLRLGWQANVGNPETANPSVPLVLDGTPFENAWALMDLGEVQLRPGKDGVKGWLGRIYASSTVAGDDIQIDYVMLLPIQESWGVIGGDGFTGSINANGQLSVQHDGVFISASGGYWTRPQLFMGDYLTVPPSGAEARTVRVACKLGREIAFSAGNPVKLPVVYDPTIGNLSARLYVTPRYLTFPD